MLPELVTYLGTSEKEQITIDVCRNRHMRRNRNAGKNRIVAHDQQERKMLDAVVEQGLDHEGVYEQSKKLDALIEKYYGEN
mgnify:CR=1 FL=1